MPAYKVAGTLAVLFSLVHIAAADEVYSENCQIVDDIESICGLRRPEDIVVAPNGRDLIFSQMEDGGTLALLDTHNHSVHTLFPGSDSSVASDELWGESSCQTPSEFLKPHGIDLSQRGDGRWQLLVVNHSGRESVEFFELVFGDQGRARAIWRGCAVAPEQGNFNDVAALPDGGFLVTHMADIDSQTWALFLIQLGIDSGFVYRWDKDTGYAPVPGTQGKMPNGIILDQDKMSFFVNMYFGDEIRKFDLASGALLGQVSVEKPDNLSWNPRGKLLVASQQSSLLALLQSLDQNDPGPSLLPFSIFEIDPVTLEKRLVLARDGGPMGAGTVAVELDGYLYIGSYIGDRMIKIALPAGD